MEKEAEKNKIARPSERAEVEAQVRPDMSETGVWGRTWGMLAAATHRAYEAISSDKKQTKALRVKKAQEIAKLEALNTINGVNFSRCQIAEIVKARDAGEKIEFESISQYLSDHNTVTGELLKNNLRNDEKIGIAIAKKLRTILPAARIISLYDEYNSDMPDSENAYGAPTMDESDSPAADDLIRPIEFSDSAKKNFRKGIESLYREEKIISDTDVEGINYLFVSESEKIKDAEILVGKLKAQGYIKETGGEIIFFNPDAENPDYKEITLRKANGHWLCAALDASTYLKTENRSIMHLVVLPDTFKEQQDKVWEILRVLDIHPTNYHNIFFDPTADPEVVAETIDREFKKYLS